MITFQIRTKNIPQTPRKTRLVVALIRQRSVDDALVILDHTPKKVAAILKKVLKNAQGIAYSRHGLKVDTLEIREIFVTKGLALKRQQLLKRDMTRHGHPFRRNLSIHRRRSHVFVKITGQKPIKVNQKTVKTLPTTKEKSHGAKS